MQKGFAHIFIILAGVLILLAIALVALGLNKGAIKSFNFNHKGSGSNNSSDYNFGNTVTSAMKLVEGERLDNHGCSGSGTVMFGTSPMDPKDVGSVLPYGAMIGDHVTPIDHMYFSPKVFNSPRDAYEVRAIGDGVVTAISRRTMHVTDKGNGQTKPEEYQLKFWHTCDFASYFDLVTSLSPRFKAEFDKHVQQGDWANLQMKVTEGELVGRIGGQTLDFAVFDYTKQLPGFVVPKHYLEESWKIHVVDPFQYFKEPVRSQLLALNPRQAEPRSGKLDYDIDGKLVGTWFKEGNNGLGDPSGENPSTWRAHISFAYDSIDPTGLMISIGDYAGETAQFAIKGNSPDWATIDTNSGLQKYELTHIEYFRGSTGEQWNRMTPHTDIKMRPQSNAQGVVLVQMEDDRKIKFEAFPGKSAGQVNGFTNSALIYER